MRKKPKLALPKPANRAIVYRPGERPKIDMSLVPPTTGESIRASFRADPVTIADMEEHLRRLEKRAPGAVITLTDAIRGLIQEGARSYREEFRDQTDDEDQ
jgi:hypothetical protein